MLREVFSQYGATMVGIISMLVFVGVFALIVFRTYRRDARDYYEQIARMPLDPSVSMENKHDRA